MKDANALRQLIAARAGGACEYCRLLEAATGATFHLEHVAPKSRGGLNVMGNLAFSCPGCNLSKGDRTTGVDQDGNVQPLFNPRDFQPPLLGWHVHFVLDHESGMILARTPIAQATIATLKMNDSNRVKARKLQIQAGLIG